MEIFNIKNLDFTYPLQKKKAIDNINLNIKKGEFLTICGKSGCGKTTLIKHLKTVLTPNGNKKGTISFYNKNIEEMDLEDQAQKIGYVLQNPEQQIVTDKVWHELAFGLESLSYSKYKIRLKVAEMASYFGIQNWFHKSVTELSGGQKQLLNLASIMAMSPEVLILDEPTAQLDPIGAVDFLETIKKINRDFGTTIIITEHRLEEIFPITDRVIVMDSGRIIADDSPREVCKILKDSNHEMFTAMPSPIRIFGEIDNNLTPLTIREGRNIIEDYFNDKPIYYKDIPIEKEDKKKKEAIKVKEVNFRYERKGKDILNNLNLTVYEGELYAIVGGNGTGKTTTLSVLSGIRKPYCGKVKISGKRCVTLPQNPECLFVKKTVYEDLIDIIHDKKLSNESVERRINEISELVHVKDFLDSHPYDLSGGEQQRVALGKVLLLNPDILLLDEPTKGLDAHFKIEFARILSKLKSTGVTIVMVSHDIEFCADYADRCGLFFDGSIVTENTTNRFFSGNSFYTTSSNRMTRCVFDNAVTVKDVVELWKKNMEQPKSQIS
ncbi:hypothetical protein SH1V18_04910 [Vallitalea longa]|uniref:ABC transporter domain-containing protein n=1 Tax=Vallitalea longa TaxID=2936439 RepID=A0A9W5Y8J9_9FIRM|nr:ATP-binding cassette domain-containing protein [Vallitalea longa]GKX28011.1 hypothetical protein SH1V18_04910 [Vallitalea longa]